MILAVLPFGLLVLGGGLAVMAWNGDVGLGFLAGVAAGVAVWLNVMLAPLGVLVWLIIFAQWLKAPAGAVTAACGAGFFDVLGFGFAINPPSGGYGVMAAGHISAVYAALGLTVLLAGVLCWRLQRMVGLWWRRGLGLLGSIMLFAGWCSLFPKLILVWHDF